MTIFNDWLPNSGYHSADAAPFERYDERFDGRTGMVRVRDLDSGQEMTQCVQGNGWAATPRPNPT
jgi:hypothetical protein